MQLSDFTFFHYADDQLFNDDLSYRGVSLCLLEEHLSTRQFQFRYHVDELLQIIAKELLLSHSLFQTTPFAIIGLNHFKTDLFLNFQYADTLATDLKEKSEHYAKRCHWQYGFCIRVNDRFFFLDNTFDGHLHYPALEKEEGMFQLLKFPNSKGHFKALSELTLAEQRQKTAKGQCIYQLEKMIKANFASCPNLSLKDILQ